MTLSLQWLSVGGLSGHAVLLLMFTLAVFAVFVWDRFEIGSVCLAVLIVLPALFFVFPLPEGVEPYRFLAGFGHPALVAICALMVLGHALVLTGALEPASRHLSWLVEQGAARWRCWSCWWARPRSAACMNDTPVVVLLIPLLMAALRRAGRAPGVMLMPMNYAVLIGGMATTIGTSTNLIVVVARRRPRRAGASACSTSSRSSRWPPCRRCSTCGSSRPGCCAMCDRALPPEAQPVFDAELRVAADTWLDGAELADVLQARRRPAAAAPHPARRRQRRARRCRRATLHAGDRLVVQDTAENLKEFEARLKAPLHSLRGPADEVDAEHQPVAAQLVVTPESPLVGRTVRSERLADEVPAGRDRPAQGARRQRRAPHRPADLRVHAGDVLLMQGPADSLQTVQRDGIGLLLDERLALPRQRKSLIALPTLAGVVLAASLGGVPIALGGAGRRAGAAGHAHRGLAGRRLGAVGQGGAAGRGQPGAGRRAHASPAARPSWRMAFVDLVAGWLGAPGCWRR